MISLLVPITNLGNSEPCNQAPHSGYFSETHYLAAPARVTVPDASSPVEHAARGAFGLATLRAAHVRVRGARVELRYRGKHGVAQAHVVRDAALARLVREMAALGARELFAYRGRGGRASDVGRAPS